MSDLNNIKKGRKSLLNQLDRIADSVAEIGMELAILRLTITAPEDPNYLWDAIDKLERTGFTQGKD